MQQHRWHPVPIVLVSAGVLAVWLVAVFNRESLGWWQVVLYLGGLVALATVGWFRRQLSASETELEAIRNRLHDEEVRLGEERAQIESLRREFEDQLQQQTRRLDKREQALADRFVAFHEWMEFPQPVDLVATGDRRVGAAVSPGAHAGHSDTEGIPNSATPDKQLAELAAKDRQMQELLKAETRILYDNLLSNKYSPEGTVLAAVVRDDMYALITKVARIYRPDIENPLLEASLARIIRSASRGCLQLLVVLDDLPLNVKDASLSTLYTYLRNAVKAWQMYKTTEPYWPYVNTAWYLGRFAMGANPLALGAWWFVSALSQRGARAVAMHLVNRQALALLASVVRVIGYEVASVYGGDFRHRDANWIYAAELTELLAQFPLSRDSLSHALKEVGVLQLRSEYDRVFLYRALAAHQSARPQQFRATHFLTIDERQAVAVRLEKFLTAFVHGKAADRVSKWKHGAEERLGVKLAVSLQPTAASVRDQLTDAVRSLASFLIATKQLEPGELTQHLASSRMLGELPAGERDQMLDGLRENPPFFFEHPDLDPDGDLVPKYLEDLAAMHARTAPRDPQCEETLADCAIFLRRDRKLMRGLLEKQYAAALAERLGPEAAGRKFPPEAARAALDLLEDGEQVRMLYGGITLEWPEAAAADDGRSSIGDSLWLLGAGQRLVLFSAGDQPKVLWKGNRDVRAEQTRTLLVTACRLTGGQWQLAGTTPTAIRIPTGLVSSYAAWFKPLLSLAGTKPGPSESPEGHPISSAGTKFGPG